VEKFALGSTFACYDSVFKMKHNFVQQKNLTTSLFFTTAQSYICMLGTHYI